MEEIASIKELTEYLCDRKKNPFCLGILVPVRTEQSLKDPEVCELRIDAPEFSLGSSDAYFKLDDEGMDKKYFTDQLTRHILSKLGYKEDRISSVLKYNYLFEKKMAGADTYLTDDDEKKMTISRDKCISAAKGYPLGGHGDRYCVCRRIGRDKGDRRDGRASQKYVLKSNSIIVKKCGWHPRAAIHK